MPPEPLQADVLGPDYRVETISLPPDSEGAVVATLVTLEPRRPNGRAVLHVHGFADYFFHTEYARWWADRGYTFYAVDLRKYGRSLREHQTPHYVSDLHEYFAEIDLAWWRITAARRAPRGHRVGALDGRPDRPAVGTRATPARAPGDGAQLAVVRHAGIGLAAQSRRTRGDRAARDGPADAGDPAQDQRRLRSLAARRARRRVGLRPGLEAARVPPGLRRLAARRAPRPRPAARRAGRAVPDPGAVVGALLLRRADRARPPRPTTSCSTSSRSAAGPRRSVGTSPRSRSRARCTTWCCRDPRSGPRCTTRSRRGSRRGSVSIRPLVPRGLLDHRTSEQQHDERGHADDGDHGA